MTGSLVLERASAVAPRRRSARLPAGWPVYALLYGYPVWWCLGFGVFIWPIMAVPMALALLKQRTVKMPKGFGIYLIFLLWMLGSAMQLSGASRVLAYLYRGSMYVSAAILLLYLFNRPKDRPSTRGIANAVSFLWATTVVGGFAGILFPHESFSSVTEKLIPVLSHNAFLRSLVHPSFADTSTLLGFALARPKAPFNYTNEWGSNLAILTPFAVYVMLIARRRLWRWLIAIGLVASIVPIIESINRGLWISLTAGFLYVAIRVGLRGHTRVLAVTLGLLGAMVATVVSTPLGHVVLERIAHPNTQTRAFLYQQATDRALESPLLGHGAPITSTMPNAAAGAAVGTHGQLWTLLVSQGFPGLFLFVGFFVALFVYTWRVNNRALWIHAAILVALVQMPVYAWLPVQIHLVALAAFVCWRQATAGSPSQGPAPQRTLPVWYEDASSLAPPRRLVSARLTGQRGAPARPGPAVGPDIPHAELRRMARGGAFNLAAVACMGLATFVLVVVLTRGLGATGYGLVATAIAVFTIFANTGELGADTGMLREIPRLLVQRRARDVRALLRVGLYPVLLVGIAMAALVWIYAPQLTDVLVRHHDGSAEVTYLRILAPFLALAPAATVALAGTRGFGNMKIFALVQNVFVPVTRPVLAGIVLLAGLGGAAVVLSWGAPLVIALVAALVCLVRFMRTAERGDAGAEPPRSTSVVAREFWSFTAARGVAGALSIAMAQISLLMVSALRSAHDAGIFSAVTRYVMMGTFAFAAMRIAIGPQIARLLAQRREGDAEAVFQTATWWLMALSWPFYLLLMIFPGTVLELFGHAFGAGAVALSLLCLSELIDMGTGNITLVLLMGGRSKWNLINIVLGLITTVTLDLLLIPPFGLVGAAIGAGTATIVINAAAVVEVAAFMKMKPFGPGYWYVVGLSAASFVGVGLIALATGLRGPIALCATVVLGGGLYLVLLFRFRSRLRLDLLAKALMQRAPVAREQVA